MEKISYVAGIIGLMVIGGMVASQVSLTLPFMVGSGDVATPIGVYLDQIMPCLLPLACFGGMYYLLGKKVKTTTILLSLIGICVGLCFLGSIL